MEANRYPTGYLDSCYGFLGTAARRDREEAEAELPLGPSPSASRARIVASFAVTLVAALAPLLGLVASVWP